MEKPKFRVFDQERFSQVCGDDMNLEKQLLSIINQTIGNDSKALQSIVNQRNTASLKSYLHHLKGTLGGIGQMALYELVKQIEARPLELNADNLLQLHLLIEKVKILMIEIDQYSKMKQNFPN